MQDTDTPQFELPETIEWRGYRYGTDVKFTPILFFQLQEQSYEEAGGKKFYTGPQTAAAKLLLRPLDKASEKALQTGAFINSLHNEDTDIEGAFAILGTIDFLSKRCMQRGNALQKSAPDLMNNRARILQKSVPASPSNTESAPDTSGLSETI